MMLYRIIDTDGNEIARVEGDVVATHAVVVITPLVGDYFSMAQVGRIQDVFKGYGIKAVVCNTPITVTQVFLPED